MKPSHIYAVHPAGYLVKFALDEGEHLADAVELLVEREYRPSHGDAWPRTPDGLPICPKHGEVMTQREKQGDTWYSHKVLDENGEVLYCRGYSGKSSPGWRVPAVKRSDATTGKTVQSSPGAQKGEKSATPATQPALVNEGLPDYRAMAVAARTEREFDYAAYMVLKNGLYDDQERITKIREILVAAWKPTKDEATTAMLAALETYRDKRQAAEGRGEAVKEAHQFALREARNAYNKAIKGE